MIQRYFHSWERQLADVSKADRKVRPFEWGLDWIDQVRTVRTVPDVRTVPVPTVPVPTVPVHTVLEGDVVRAWVDEVMRDSDAFFTPEPTREYKLENGLLSFPSGFTTPHVENNLVRARYFPADPIRKPAPGSVRRAVVVLAQWNSDSEGHVGLCKILSKLGIASLRISLPYHDQRRPPELTRADYIVSSNIARTVQVCRQAVQDVRLALWWLRDQGYERLGLLGTSLGSCLCYLTAAHEPLVRAQALNHVSPFFGDVVWRGMSTEHVREGLEGHVDMEQLRDLWRPISPWSYLDRLRDTSTLMVYAKYDLTFPVDLSLQLIDELRRRHMPLKVSVLPCGHYSTGSAPFKYLDGWYLCNFLARNL